MDINKKSARRFFSLKNSIIFLSAFFACFAFINQTSAKTMSMREKWNHELTSGEWEVETYNLSRDAMNEVYYLFYKNKKLRLIKYQEYDTSAGEEDIFYTAVYNASGNLEYAYYLVRFGNLKNRGVVFGKDVHSGDEKFPIKQSENRSIYYNIRLFNKYITDRALSAEDHYRYSRILKQPVKFHYPKQGEYTYITGSRVRLRSAPSLQSKIYGLMEASDFVKVMENDLNTSWAKILFSSNVGYVSAQFLQPIQEETAPSYWVKNTCSGIRNPVPQAITKSYLNIDNVKGEAHENLNLTENIDLEIIHSGCEMYMLQLRFYVKGDSFQNNTGVDLFKNYVKLFTLAKDKLHFYPGIDSLKEKISKNDFTNKQDILIYKSQFADSISLSLKDVQKNENITIYEAVFLFGRFK